MRNWFRRSGHATIVAYLALFLAVGGGAFAIAKGTKINGSKLKNRSVPASKLQKNSITGAEVNLGKLGTVPSAKSAETAGSATTAKTAESANTANTATSAASVATLTAPTTVRAPSSGSGPNLAAAQAAAVPVAVYEDSHFRIYGKCFLDEGGSNQYGSLYIETKQNGAILDSGEDDLGGSAPDGYLNTNTPENLRELTVTGVSSSKAEAIGPEGLYATGADGYVLNGEFETAIKNGTVPAGEGPYGPGSVCLFSGFVIHS